MNHIKKPSACGLLAALMAAGLASCSDDNPWGQSASDAQGQVQLAVAASADVEDALPHVTRATAPDIPSEDDFKITIERLDGSWSASYASVSEFNNAEGFKTGAYMLTASYGSLAEEGFAKPFYEGSAQFTVLENQNTAVAVVAQLANSLVDIDYTPEFREYFSAWSATVHSEGHDYVDFSQDETRPAYVAPGTVAISVTLTNQEGKTTQIQPCSFEALARHHYHVTFNVNGGNVGAAQLEVIFDDSLTQENVEVDLTDELFLVKAPAITTAGFENGATIESLQGNALATPATMSVQALGGLSSALLTIDSDNFTPSFGAEIDLCHASEAQQLQIAAAGIQAKGFFRNPDQLAYLDLAGFTAHLPVGRHKITLLAKDKLDRASDPVSVTFDIQKVELAAAPGSSIMGSRQASVRVSYNGANPADDITFTAMDNAGQWADAPAVSVSEVPATRGFDIKMYDFTLSIPDCERNEVPLKMYLKGVEQAQLSVPVTYPEYTVQADPYAKWAKLKVTSDADLSSICNALVFTLTGANSSHVVRKTDGARGYIYLSGLTPSSQYSLQYSLTAAGEKHTVDFRTESETQLPNSDFSELEQTINIPKINVGGEWKVWPAKYFNKSSILVSEPVGWASINKKTAYTGSDPLNTWFVVPSTMAADGQVKVRSVAYSHNGQLPAVTGGAGSTTYYNPNPPAESVFTKAAGELYLGSYSFDGSESRTDGLAWSSRPQSLSFDFSYAPLNNEEGEVRVQLIDAAGNTIASATSKLGAKSAMGRYTVPMPEYPFGSNAAQIRVSFRSSTAAAPAVTIPSGNALNEGARWDNFTSYTIAANQYKALATGSELVIANLSLGYEIPESLQAKKRNTKKKK